MKTDPVWQAFAETGDPVYYLLYKAVRDRKGGIKKDESGEEPRLED